MDRIRSWPVGYSNTLARGGDVATLPGGLPLVRHPIGGFDGTIVSFVWDPFSQLQKECTLPILILPGYACRYASGVQSSFEDFQSPSALIATVQRLHIRRLIPRKRHSIVHSAGSLIVHRTVPARPKGAGIK